MANIGFVGCLAAACLLLFRWAFRELPREEFQVIATIPLSKNPDGSWHGLNFTYYGLFTASAYLVATMVVFVLLGALSIPTDSILMLSAAILIVCVPSSKSIAKFVEKKAYTFSVGGAAFIGILIAPWILYAMEKLPGLPSASDGFVLPGMAALSIAYALGEGLGRLACISFGCCYGKPIEKVPRLLQRLVGFRTFIFTGKTKKVAYASRLDGQKLFPVQAVTATLYVGIALSGTYLFLLGKYGSAFLITLSVTQLWRFLSEFLRADFRGNQSLTAYQIMALLSIPYAGLMVHIHPAVHTTPSNLFLGLALLWNPFLILTFIALWIGIFLFTGRSQVTAATVNIFVNEQNI
jgi:hypothetical protein